METDTLNRFDRIVAILIHLQSGRVIKAQELAERFGVSLRTIYRDIRSLEAGGVPIAGEAGVGYSLLEGYRLPPVMFTREEAASFVAAEKLMQKFTDKTLRSHYQAALYKVKSVLKGTTKDRLAALESQIWITESEELFNRNLPDALNILLESMADKLQVALQYQTGYSEELSDRIIEPIGLFHENHFWYIKAYCLLRADYRQFRADRILQIKRTGKPFSKDHSQVPLVETCPLEEQTQVVIRVKKEAARYIRTGRKYYGFVSEKTVGQQVEMTFLSPNAHDALARWYLMFADCAEIIEPESFRTQVGQLLEKAKANLHPETVEGIR